MAIPKPTKDFTNFLPNGFGTASGVVKNDFSDTKKLNGFSANVEDILQGDNLNYTLDTIGKQLKYLTTVVEFINSMQANQVLYVDTNNQLNSGTIHTFLPSQSGNSGKFLTTNGANQLSWAESLTDIGDPIFTLNFNKVLDETKYVWLEGAVKPITGDFARLFAIYGYQYDTSYTGTSNFRLPNFLNRSIWGGTTAGYLEAGLPNITGSFEGASQNGNRTSGAFYVIGRNTKVLNDGEKDNTYGFDASRSSSIYGNSSTVQPPAIKVRVYTRYK